MDAVKFIQERNRMCKSFHDGEGCMSCPVYKEGSRCMAILWKEEIIPVVEKWSKENPCKTRQSVFLEQYPEAAIDSYGVLNLCPTPISKSHRNIYGKCAHAGVKCDQCRREFWMQEVE